MRFKIDELREPVAVAIKGQEPWLSLIYQSFGLKGDAADPLITGNFTLTPGSYGTYYIKGEVSFTPLINCGRCELLIPWDIKRSFDVRFLTPYEEDGVAAEKDLTPEDLDDYYIENGEINVEPIINDLIQTALPVRALRTTPDGKNCEVCLEDVEKPLVYEQPTDPNSSPFAVLKNLKLPE